MISPLAKEVLLYGGILFKEDIETKDNCFITYRILLYHGKIYFHKMVNGDEVEFVKITDLDGGC